MNTVPGLRALATGTLLTLLSTMTALPGWAADPLPSWRDTAAKRAILTYVNRATQPGSSDFVPAPLVADHYRGLFHIVALTHAGMTTGKFSSRVDRWMATACHPRFARPYDATIYQPMRELLAFLLRNGFHSYIVSGGGADFMRNWSGRVYGIPPEHVVAHAARWSTHCATALLSC